MRYKADNLSPFDQVKTPLAVKIGLILFIQGFSFFESRSRAASVYKGSRQWLNESRISTIPTSVNIDIDIK